MDSLRQLCQRAQRSRLGRASIWHPDAIPASEGRASIELKRYVLPVFDVVLVVMGIVAVKLGMPTFDIVLNPFISTSSAWTLLGAAVTALVGLAFPRLWVAEALGKVLMVIVLAGYAAGLWVQVWLGDENRGVVAAAFTGLLLLPMWNLGRIGRERRARKAAGSNA